VRIFLKDLGFPNMPWVRRIFIGLDEASFKDPLPQWLIEDLEDFGKSFFGTLAVENMFNKASATKKQRSRGR
jgi:hypothetical protein